MIYDSNLGFKSESSIEIFQDKISNIELYLHHIQQLIINLSSELEKIQPELDNLKKELEERF